MAGKGLHTYTVAEAQNATMGQVGSVFLDTDGTTFTPSSGIIVAITVVTDCDFDVLTAEDSAKYISVGGTGYESGGDTLANTDQFPAGLTLYGRWTSVSVNTTGSCICYVA
tara:strand:+ start:99 stop:431 length:333 start_codon:yes stop_codon:yes gene_type:complete